MWGHKPILQRQNEQLQGLNRLTMKCMAPIRPSTPTFGLEIILGQKPLDIVIRGEGLKAYPRVKDVTVGLGSIWSGIGKQKGVKIQKHGHLKAWKELAARNKIEILGEDKVHLQFNWNKPFKRKGFQDWTGQQSNCWSAHLSSFKAKGQDTRVVSFNIYNGLVNIDEQAMRFEWHHSPSIVLKQGLFYILKTILSKIDSGVIPKKIDIYSTVQIGGINNNLIQEASTVEVLEHLKAVQVGTGFKVNFPPQNGWCSARRQRADWA